MSVKYDYYDYLARNQVHKHGSTLVIALGHGCHFFCSYATGSKSIGQPGKKKPSFWGSLTHNFIWAILGMCRGMGQGI